MPKERSHWLFARRVAAALPPGALADAVQGYGEYFLAGSVAHDSPYYCLDSPQERQTADRLHGSGGQDSFAPFRALADHRGNLGAEAFAFGLGALTHLAADVTFHPLVFSWTGEFGYAHQALETALDLHLEALWGPAPARTYASLARKAGPTLGQVYQAWTGQNPRTWMASHRRLQGLFHLRPLRWVAGDYAGAFYPSGPVRHPAFEGTLEWSDPVTGAPGRATLDELVIRFETFALDLAAEWERAWISGEEPFAGAVGPALDTGIPADREQTKRYFTAKWFPSSRFGRIPGK